MALSLYKYQLLLVDETRDYRVDTFGALLYNGYHYDVITSLPGYFSTS